MTDREWLARLEWFGIKLGLDTIGALAAALGHPDHAYPVVHVAGTNGKGSVVAMLERAIRASGRRTGRYTSPHLVRLEERFAIDGVPVEPAELDRALSIVRRAAESRALADPHLPAPTYFEVTTAAAFEVFRSAAVDVAVIEVGLGGRFDATNVVSPVLSVITSIDFDHEAHLGRTLGAIAGEKAGIIKPGVPVVVGPVGSEALDVVSRTAAAAGAPLHLVTEECRVEARSLGSGRREATFRTRRGTYGPVVLALRGNYQVANAAIAVVAADRLSELGLAMDPAAVVTGLADARWPGRLDVIEIGDRRITIDGAHNAAGAEALAAYLREAHPEGVPVVFGVMTDKAIDGMIAAIAPLARPLVVTRAPGRRAATAEDLASRARRVMPADCVLEEPDVGRALDTAWRHHRDIVAAGSLYLAGDIIARLDLETTRHRE